MLLNYLEICAQINEGNQKDPAMLAKAMTLGIEAMRLAEDENNTAMANILVKQVDVSLNGNWIGIRKQHKLWRNRVLNTIILHYLFSQL
jgi:hypothetical protein